MLKLKRFFKILKRTGLFNMFIGFLICYFVAAFLLMVFEPQVANYSEGLWFCFVSFSTIGFGDITAVTLFGRIVIIFITLYAAVVLAMIPGVIVSYYTEYLKAKENETISTFLEKLEKLPELSKSELEELSDRVKKFNSNKKDKHDHLKEL